MPAPVPPGAHPAPEPGGAVRPELEPPNVLSWRFEELVRAGYPVDIAITLAERRDVDLHEACDLLARGCPVEQAINILY